MINFRDWNDDLLRAIQAPTLLIVSNKDVITIEHTLELSHLIPDSQLVVLPGYHGGFIADACSGPENTRLAHITAELIRHFLEE